MISYIKYHFMKMIVIKIIVFTICNMPIAAFSSVYYAYDDLNRVVKIDYGNGYVESYNYDDAGNRLTYALAQITNSVDLNAGSSVTNSTEVNLSLSCYGTPGCGCTEMQFSNDGSSWSTAEIYSQTATWSLEAGEGSRTVYTRLRDCENNWSNSFSDTIFLAPYRLSGTVYSPDGDPIEGAIVRIKPQSAMTPPAITNSSGAYWLEYLTSGDYKLGVRKSGCYIPVRLFTISGEDVSIDIKVLRCNTQ